MGIIVSYARFDVFTAKIQFVVFWVVAPISVAVGYQRFGEPSCFHLQGEGSKVIRNVGILT
jgi:hypothetical protein